MNEELKIIISAEISKLKKGVEDAKKHIANFTKDSERGASRMDKAFAAIGKSITKATQTIGIGIAGIGTALLATAASTEEYRNQQALLVSAFENAGASADTAKTVYKNLYRVMGDGDAATEASQSLARLTSDEKALGEYTTILTGIWGDYGKGMPIETIAEAITETAKCGTVTGDLSRALVEAGVSEEDFNEKLAACNTEAEREKLIRETLTGLYAESAANYEENNKKVLEQRDAQAALQEKLAAVGEALAPIITAFTSFAADALAIVEPYISSLAELLLPALKTILDNVVVALQNAAQWITENKTLLEGIAIAIGIVVAAIGMYNAVAAIKAGMAALEVASVWGLVSAYAAQATAMLGAIAPYLLIAAAIAAIILIILNWGEVWEWIKGVAATCWEAIKATWEVVSEWFSKNVVEPVQNAFSGIEEWFSELFKNAWQSVQNAWNGAAKWFSGVWDNIKKAFSNVGTWFKDIFQTAWTNIQKVFSYVASFFGGVWDAIKKIFSDVGTAIANGIKGAVSGAVNVILGAAVNIINGFISAINFAIDIINGIPGVSITRLNKLSVPAMAKGGVVDSATLALIGENGKEAVLPLENNLEYLDKLAGMINERMNGGNRPIVLNVDGKRFAEISVENINNLTRQRGSIPLVMA